MAYSFEVNVRLSGVDFNLSDTVDSHKTAHQ